MYQRDNVVREKSLSSDRAAFVHRGGSHCVASPSSLPPIYFLHHFSMTPSLESYFWSDDQDGIAFNQHHLLARTPPTCTLHHLELQCMLCCIVRGDASSGVLHGKIPSLDFEPGSGTLMVSHADGLVYQVGDRASDPAAFQTWHHLTSAPEMMRSLSRPTHHHTGRQAFVLFGQKEETLQLSAAEEFHPPRIVQV